MWRVLLCLTLLIGCSNNPNVRNEYAGVTAWMQGQKPEFAPRFIERLRDNAQTLQIAFVQRGVSSNLLLEREQGAFTYWISVTGAHIVLESGMLHSTRGIGEGLLASETRETFALVSAMQSGDANRFHTYLDGNDRTVTRTYRCLVTNDGPQDVTFRGNTTPTIIMTERCTNSEQAFVNFYWVVPQTKQIIKTRQWSGPELGPLSTRIIPL